MNKSIEEAAELLRNAYISGPVNPLRQFVEPTDADLAYKIQNTNTEQWLSEGRQIAGWKIGLTAKAVQKQLGVNQPDFGVLFSDMAVPTQSIFQMNKVIQPRGEAEIALILGDDIDHPEVTVKDIKKAIEYVVPAIEIVDSRITDWRISFADTVADNGSSAFYVLGEQRMPLNDLDLYTCGMVLEVNGEIASLGAGAMSGA